MVMGNASIRKDGEGTSGVKNSEYGDGSEQSMEFGQGEAHVSYYEHGGFLDPMVHSPPQTAYQSPLTFHPQFQVAAGPLTRPGEGMQVQNPATEHNMAYYNEKQTAMIKWSYGGDQVAVSGSWDNWGIVEYLWRLGNDFIIMKVLPLGLYHYRFIVDGQLRHAPDLPWGIDDSGIAYNILNLLVEPCASKVEPYALRVEPNNFMYNSVASDYVLEAPEGLPEFDSPPSPFSSYDNEPLNSIDFSEPPPEAPPQLHMTLLDDPSPMASNQSLQNPQHTVLNHLYIQKNDTGMPVALGSTYRFRQKYVTLVLYKPSGR